jgi:NAD(P)-dependent dehydrogenase (short-subunit alcohol dehydrogenase family)
VELEGTAVVTGAASGIGLAMARRFAAAGMNVVMADVEGGALAQAAADLASSGVTVLAQETDVSDPGSVSELARLCAERFGAVNLLCNNAGVSGGGGPIWSATPDDWTWVLGVNLMGVVNGIRAFLPGMLGSGQPGHVVNTSSVLGLSTGGASIYSVSKHAVTRLSEGLWYDLRAAQAPIGVSVLCPGMVATRIISADRNRPDRLSDTAASNEQHDRMRQAAEARFQSEGMDPADVAERVAAAVRTGTFYILTHPDSIKPAVEARMRAIVEEVDPPTPFQLA